MINVYVSDYAEHIIPDDVWQKAIALTKEYRLHDQRTKGAQYLKKVMNEIALKEYLANNQTA